MMLANFMNLLDVTIVNVALPSLQSELAATSSQIEWVVAGYVLVFALGLLPFGRLGDVRGKKQVFLVGVAAFTFASLMWHPISAGWWQPGCCRAPEPP